MNRPNENEQNPKVWHDWFETLPVGTQLTYQCGEKIRSAIVVKANFPSVSGRAHIYNCAKFTDTNTLAKNVWLSFFDVDVKERREKKFFEMLDGMGGEANTFLDTLNKGMEAQCK